MTWWVKHIELSTFSENREPPQKFLWFTIDDYFHFETRGTETLVKIKDCNKSLDLDSKWKVGVAWTHFALSVQMGRTDRYSAHVLTPECCMGSLTRFQKVTVKIFLIKLKVRGEPVWLLLAALGERIHNDLLISLILSHSLLAILLTISAWRNGGVISVKS